MNRNVAEPLVSIALCTYNGSKYLREQLDSLFLQSYPNFEIVAIDDCSTDDTVAILKTYSARDSRLLVHVNPQNLGFKRNFEIALRRCRGAYIAPCDQDDIWLPNKLAALLAAIGKSSMVYCNSELIAANGEALGIRTSDLHSMLTTDDPAAFLFANCVSGHAMLFRREILDRALPIPDEFFHDWWLAIVATAAGGIIYHNQPLVQYRQHTNNVTDMLRARQVVPRSQRPLGFRLRHLREIGGRIGLLASLPGRHQALLMKLKQLWTARESQWLSIALALFMARYGPRLYATQRRVSRLGLLRRSMDYIWGLKTKRCANRRAYAAE